MRKNVQNNQMPQAWNNALQSNGLPFASTMTIGWRGSLIFAQVDPTPVAYSSLPGQGQMVGPAFTSR